MMTPDPKPFIPDIDPRKENPTRPNPGIPERSPDEGQEKPTQPGRHVPEVNPDKPEEAPVRPRTNISEKALDRLKITVIA